MRPLVRLICLVLCLVATGPALAQPKAGKADRTVALLKKARALLEEGKWREAVPYFRQALEQSSKTHGPNHKTTLQLMEATAEAYRNTGELNQAAALLETCLQRTEKLLGKGHLDVARVLYLLGRVELTRANYDLAEKHFQRCITIRQKELGPDHIDVGTALVELAFVLRERGDLGKAELVGKLALSIHEKKLGKENAQTAYCLICLGGVYHRLRQFDRALPMFRRALTIREVTLGTDHVNVASSLTDVATVLSIQGKYKEALPLYHRSLEIRVKRLGPSHHEVARNMHDVAYMFSKVGQDDKALPLFQAALKIKNQRLGKDHPNNMATLSMLADIHVRKKQYKEALDYYKQYLAIGEQRLGRDNPSVTETLHQLGMLASALGSPETASKLFDRARRSVSRYAVKVLPTLSERDQGDFLNNQYDEMFRLALSLGANHPNNQEIVERSASWLINGKAIAHEALAGTSLLSRDRGNANLGPHISQLEKVREQLGRLTLAKPDMGKEKEHLVRLDKLSEREQELARKIRVLGGGVTASWVELATVRQAMPPRSVFIDVIRTQVRDYKNNRMLAPRYLAWVIPHEGEVQIVDLGLAQPIDDRVNQARKLIDDADKHIKAQGEVNAEKELRAALAPVSQQVLQPLLSRVGSARLLLVSPDAQLWLVPWEILPLPGDKYAIEEYQFRYAVTGRDLARARSRVKASPPLILADPDYGNEGKAGPMRKSRLRAVERLPATASEAQAVLPKLQTWTKMAPELLQRGEATEAAIKKVRNPRALHLATHGFVIPEKDGDGAKKKWENPLLRTGLMLADCNKPRTGNKDDGVLTALDVCGLDLRGCSLVVLSACETGLGKVRTGEGVAGLRQSFLLAGSSSVVASLWSVPDRETALLMKGMYDNLAKGVSKSTALRRAQLSMIEERRKDRAAAHPLFWGAFTLTGK